MTLATPMLPIARRLLGWVLWSALLCAGLAIVVQTLVLQRQITAQFQALTEDLGKTHVPLLTHALWSVELDVLEQQLAQIAARPEVAGALLESPTGVRLVAGTPRLEALPDTMLPLPHPRGEPAPLGVLHLYAEAGHLQRAIAQAALQRVLEIALFTALICFLICWRLRRELAEPLRALAGYVSQLAPGRAAPAAPLARPSRRWHDEIDLVLHGFEALNDSLQHYGAERDLAMTELATERDRLDRRVEQRTASLKRINGYLDLFSRTLMRCIHLPLAGYPDALHQALGELGDRVGAHACGLATRSADGAWCWQVIWHRDGADCAAEAAGALLLSWHGNGWLLDPTRPDLRAYQLADDDGGNLLVLQHAPALPSDEEQRYQQMAAEMLFSLLERWEHARQLEATRQELERLSRCDPLTGLANRRHFDERWADELRRASRSGRPLTVLMLDVDHFKGYNDRYGHGAGDQCLSAIAGCLSSLFQRAGELPARLGGEEFAVLLPGAGAGEAAQAAERLRQAIVDLNLAHAGSPLGQVTASIGHATWPGDTGQALASLLQQADQALYAAKAAGRNRVCP